ncbi:MAG: tripartite tricarboxylate transporter TctB family protein [Bacillota bacterium]
MKKEDVIAGIIFLTISVALFLQTLTFPAPPVQGSGPSFWPRLLLIILAILSIALIVSAFRNKIISAVINVDIKEKENAKKKMSKPLWGIISAVLFVLLFKKLGFFLSTFFFLYALTFIIQFDLTPKKILTRALQSSLLVGVIYLLFGFFLKVNLPKGILF